MTGVQTCALPILLFVDGNPAGVKAMLNVMGLIENKLLTERTEKGRGNCF